MSISNTFVEVDDSAKLLSRSPDIIGISSFTETFEEVKKHCRFIKNQNPNMPIIIGGEHISALPQSLPETADYGIRGEGEETLTELLHLHQTHKVSPENLSKINGLVFRHQGQLIITPPRSWIMDLDSIPPPDRKLLEEHPYHWQQTLFTARGCPYKCTFCSATKFWERTRYHSIERVVSEIEYIIQHFPNQEVLPISDDLFPLNKKRLKRIVQAVCDKGLHKKISFTCNARASVFNDEIAQLLVQMNVQGVYFGFESASDRILKQLKGKAKAVENQKALEICEKYGLSTVGSFLLGSTDETIEDMSKTYWFIHHNRKQMWRPNICFSTPYPGTEFWEEVKRRNLVNDNFSQWSKLDMGFKHSQSIYMNQHLSQDEFEPIYKSFYQRLSKGQEQLEQELYQLQIRRFYISKTLRQIADLYPSTIDKALEISNEGIHLKHLLDKPDIQRLYVKDGNLQPHSIPEESVPLIIMSHTLEKVLNPFQVLNEIKRLLTPDGQLVLLTFNSFHISFVIELFLGRWSETNFGVYQHDHLNFFSIPGLIKELKNNQWSIHKVDKLKMDITRFQPYIQQIIPLFKHVINLKLFEKSYDAFSSLICASKADLIEQENENNYAISQKAGSL